MLIEIGFTIVVPFIPVVPPAIKRWMSKIGKDRFIWGNKAWKLGKI